MALISQENVFSKNAGFLPEVLAPAGSLESLKAAVRTGADAVYLGVEEFSARKNAKNFTIDYISERDGHQTLDFSWDNDLSPSLKSVIDYCHIRNVKVYLTLNTMIREDELEKAFEVAQKAYLYGVDAFILQDLGLTKLIRENLPNVPLHASTQLSCINKEGVKALVSLGFSRVVIAREMTLEEIKSCVGLGAEIEVFVHGALCMCVSGQCTFSAMLGGRSGNRGLCAQPCRLPFSQSGYTHDINNPSGKLKENFLSLKDLSLLKHIKALAGIGVNSFKIEGRMKRPEYVASATAAYKNARDDFLQDIYPANYPISSGHTEQGYLPDEEALQKVFSRSGFSDGYLKGRRNAEMFGIRSHEDVLAADEVMGKIAALFKDELQKISVAFHFTAKQGEKISLTANDNEGCSVTVKGDIPQKAINLPLDEERAIAQLSKSGGTPFKVSVSAEIEEGLSVPIKALNSLRRDALDALASQRSESQRSESHFAQTPPAPMTADKSAIAFNPNFFGKENSTSPLKQMKAAVLSPLYRDAPPKNADLVFLPLTLPLKEIEALVRDDNYKDKLGIEIPRGVFAFDAFDKLEKLKEFGITKLLCGNFSLIAPLREKGFEIIANYSHNIANSMGADEILTLGASACILSQELSFPQLAFAETSPSQSGLVVYGNQHLMLLRNCPLKANMGGCSSCSNFSANRKDNNNPKIRPGVLKDRKNIEFDLACYDEICGTVELINSRPLYLADMLEKLPKVAYNLFLFHKESKERAEAVLNGYNFEGRGKVSDNNFFGKNELFTRGLYTKGVI